MQTAKEIFLEMLKPDAQPERQLKQYEALHMCRYPAKRLSSMEAFGLFVSNVCSRSGLGYNYGARTMTYTSCLLYSEE